MPLPKEGTAWPPVNIAPAYDRYRFDEALWLNDTEELGSILRGGSSNTPDGRRTAEYAKRRGLLVSIMRRWGWARLTPDGEKRTDLPVPIGADIVDLSAAQLMSEPPMFRTVKRENDGSVKRDKGPAQQRLDRIATSDDARMTLVEGAQVASAIGGVVLKAQWDIDDPDRQSVWFDAVGADCAIPEFNAAGRLVGVTLWQEYAAPIGSKILRYLERHAVGVIERALYEGTQTSIGRQVSLDKIDIGADLLTLKGVQMDGNVALLGTGLDRLTAAYWKNRPTRRWRRSGNLANLGRSDFELIEPLLDAYSEAWGSMMRDVRLGKARAFIPPGTLERIGGAGAGGMFDADREFYQEVNGLQPDAGVDVIKVEQPDIRWEAHMRTLAGIKLEILDGAGWSLSSFGNPSGADSGGSGGGGTTATEVVDRTTKSERTRDEKARYFSGAANPFFRMLLELDSKLYPAGGAAEVGELAIDFPDVSQVDPEKQARTFSSLSSVYAISIDQMIRERKPDWDDDEVATERARILKDLEETRGGVAPDPAIIGRTEPPEPDDPDAPPEPPAADPGEPAKAA
jgi:hypothetical protein